MAFITFEGLDGSGKSSLLELLSEHLKKQGKTVEVTREPGGTPLGLELRKNLLRKDLPAPCPEAELLIYGADRAHHVQSKIRPLLKQGVWVLSDRFFDSSMAFQGAGRKISKEDVLWLNRFATGGLTPNLTVLVDCEVETAMGRSQKRGEQDRIESEKLDFHIAVRKEFLEIARKEPQRFLVVSSEIKKPEELLPEVLKALESKGLL